MGASEYQCAGLVTQATFSSLQTVASDHSGFASLFFGANEFDNGSRIRSVTCPSLILHGDQDTVVDVQQAFELSVQCGTNAPERPPVTLDVRAGVNHNNYDIMKDIISPIQKAFPNIQDGKPLPLATADAILRRQPL